MELTKINETMTSLQIAEITGKLHKNLLRDIRVMEEAWEKINGLKFELVEYTDAKGEKRPYYKLTKTECLYIATKFNDEARAKLIIRWEELEKQNQPTEKPLPRNYKEALQALLLEVEHNEQLQIKIEEDKPKVEFAEALLTCQSSCLIGELAKIITQNGYTIGQNRLFQWMRDNNYLLKSGEKRNMPKQLYVEQGLFEIKKGYRVDKNGVNYTTSTTKVTVKGQQYFISRFKGLLAQQLRRI